MRIEENGVSARRYGLDARMVDWRRNEVIPTSVRYERWLARLLPAATNLGLWPQLELAVDAALSEGTGAEQQRVWRREGGSFECVVKSLVDATAAARTTPSPTRQSHR